MRYIGETCPYCGNQFAENDDIVVCPDCGTPHHRSCWAAHGSCANSAAHAQDYVWKKTVQPEAEQEQPKPRDNTDGKSLDIVCPDCGKVCPNGTLRCPDCGAILVPQFSAGGMPPLTQFRPEFNPNEDIDGMKSGDIALHCRTGGGRYINAFRKRANGKKFTWNWAALLFSPFWFFYRKLWKAGIIFFALFLAIEIWQMPYAQKLNESYDEIISEFNAVTEEYRNGSADGSAAESAAGGEVSVRTASISEEQRQDNYINGMKAVYTKHKDVFYPLIWPALSRLALNIVAAFLADRIYRKKMKADIERIRTDNSDERTVQAELFRTGGVSLLWGFGTYIGYDLLLRLVSFLLYK